MTEDTFLTISGPAEGFFKDRGSRFLAFAFPVSSENQARNHWNSLKDLHPKAVHWCYAWRTADGRYRANDDGEPSGSAGKPILNVLYSRKLTNLVVIVVRYFGGSLLGVPGLINAYKSATEAALDSAGIVEGFLTVSLRILFPYESMNTVMRAVKEFDLEVLNPVYELDCSLEVAVRQSEAPALKERCLLDENIQIEEIITEETD